MPRKKLIYTTKCPYHVVARSNNRDWFHDLSVVWTIFDQEIQEIQKNWGAQIHSFVLMANHYHLLISASQAFTLGQIMNVFQTRVSKRINSQRNTINHVFGGQYKASLITDSSSFLRVLRYVYQNPVKAKITHCVEDYQYSTVDTHCAPRGFEVNFLKTNIFKGVNDHLRNGTLMEFLNQKETEPAYEQIKKALVRTQFKIAAFQSSQRNAVAKPNVA